MEEGLLPIPAQYYALVYSLIVFLFAIPVCSRYSRYSSGRVETAPVEPLSKSLLFTIFIIIFVAIRPNSPVFADGPGYWEAILDHRWEEMTLKDVYYQFATKYLIGGMSSLGLNPRIGFFVYAIIEYGFALIAMRKLFPKDTMLAMVMYCGTFGVFGGAVNGIKNGMALSVFLCALAYRENWKIFVPLLIISFGFHHSLELNIAAFIVCYFYKKTKVYKLLWVLGVMIAAAHISTFQTFFAGYTDEHGAGYLITDSESWVTGFRPDFILYSSAPVILGWWLRKKIKYDNQEEYNFYLNSYLLMNTIWLLCMYSAYTNRIAALSWAVFPIVLLYPFLKFQFHYRQYTYLSWVVYGQLAFTSLMDIIYIDRV